MNNKAVSYSIFTHNEVFYFFSLPKLSRCKVPFSHPISVVYARARELRCCYFFLLISLKVCLLIVSIILSTNKTLRVFLLQVQAPAVSYSDYLSTIMSTRMKSTKYDIGSTKYDYILVSTRIGSTIIPRTKKVCSLFSMLEVRELFLCWKYEKCLYSKKKTN